MLYLITAQHSTAIDYADTIPSSLQPHVLPGASALAGAGPFGKFLLQEFPAGSDLNTTIWHAHYEMDREEVFHYHSRAPRLRLHFALSNSFYYRLEGMEEQILHEGNFNLFYSPYVNSEITMYPGRAYTMFSIYFSVAFLESWVRYFPVLAPFIDKIKNNEPALLCQHSQVSNAQIDAILRQMMRNHFVGAGGSYYTELKINELLLLVLDKVSRNPSTGPVRLRRDEVERLYDLKELLLQNIQRPLSLKELSRKFGFNVNKIKSGFKELYQQSPFDLLLVTRMEKAKDLLRTTDKSMDDIGEMVGYDNKYSFSKAFKKYVGQPPAGYRKNQREAQKALTIMYNCAS